MRINTNMNAMIATNQMSKNTALSGASMEKLSTGLRITKAGDDATGLAISEKMRAQIRGMEQADRNVQDGISMVQTAEGALEEIGNITQRMRELTVQASNETNSVDDRTKITEELTQLKSEIDRISESTTFNGEKILIGSKGFEAANILDTGKTDKISDLKITKELSTVEKLTIKAEQGQTQDDTKITLTVKVDNKDTSFVAEIKKNGAGKEQEVNFKDLGISFKINTNDATAAIGGTEREIKLQDGLGTKEVGIQAGANNEDSNSLDITLGAMNTKALGITDADIANIADADKAKGTEAAKEFITKLDDALSNINTTRSRLGAQQNRLEYTSSNLVSSTENLSAAESRIRDVDVAKEMVKLSKLNILNQASQAMVSQAKQQPESVSQLLR